MFYHFDISYPFKTNSTLYNNLYPLYEVYVTIIIAVKEPFKSL
jgi:hypothetical protein